MVAPAPEARREFALDPSDNARLANLCGPLDENLRLLETRLDVQIHRRGDNFRVSGAQAIHAENAAAGAVRSHEERGQSRPSACTWRCANASPDRPPGQSARARCPGAARRIRARGEHQREYLEHIRTRDLTFGIGPAGTGKTYLAVACAVEALQAERVRRIILVRPAVEAGERLGFLPGDLTQKVDPYLRPMYDALYEMMGFDRVARFIERNVIEVAPLAFMRGRSLNDSFIILDEAQNTTIEQMKMFLTRIGFGSKAVVTGDVTQTDLPAGKQSGLST